MNTHHDRPAGPWDANVDAGAAAVAQRRAAAVEDPRIRFRGRGEREALAGEVPVRLLAASRVARVERGRLLRIQNDRRAADLVSVDELAALSIDPRRI